MLVEFSVRPTDHNLCNIFFIDSTPEYWSHSIKTNQTSIALCKETLPDFSWFDLNSFKSMNLIIKNAKFQLVLATVWGFFTYNNRLKALFCFVWPERMRWNSLWRSEDHISMYVLLPYLTPSLIITRDILEKYFNNELLLTAVLDNSINTTENKTMYKVFLSNRDQGGNIVKRGFLVFIFLMYGRYGEDATWTYWFGGEGIRETQIPPLLVSTR